MTTPAQQAKEYAAAHGFTLIRIGDKIRVYHGDKTIGDRSKYEAVLNLMQRPIYAPPWALCASGLGYMELRFHNYSDAVKELRRMHKSRGTFTIQYRPV